MNHIFRLFLITLLVFSIPMSQGQKEAFHQPLLFKNHFKDPKKVIQYYVKRDASGFVWSGLLEVEKAAFTLWKSVPENDSFFIAKQYRIQTPQISGTEAKVRVDYEILAVSDAHGTRTPAMVRDYSVEFVLIKVKGRWKIASPGPDQIAPVVIEEKFSG